MEGSMMELQEVRVLAEGLAFPEGPVALPDGSVILVEMNAGRLSRVHPDHNVTVVAEVGGGPNGAAIGPDGALYVCNNGMSSDPSTACIQRVDIEDGSHEVLYTCWEDLPLSLPNDIVFDTTGHFWFTDFGNNAIFYAGVDGKSIRRVIAGASQPNGIGLSPEGDVLYWSETNTRQLHRRHLTGPGQIVDSVGCGLMSLLSSGSVDRWSLVAGLPGASALDSLAVEAGGMVCVGTLIDSGVTVFNTDDGSHELYRLPPALADGAVTNICFGGAALRIAYITCSQNGRLLSCRWPRPGLPLAFQELP
jgi:gluconolactonase